ncbi:hypothetical protein ZIOFF_027808 [Zingiber officinale]|uniref:Uncharacterized protein n=1 Tax=Zingiber officinale TaxID=94328 RepID=A0A8J5LDG2_ZINOF|nr:hypothetical protein ZIOFF_027808 [Zingiber officinale]
MSPPSPPASIDASPILSAANVSAGRDFRRRSAPPAGRVPHPEAAAASTSGLPTVDSDSGTAAVLAACGTDLTHSRVNRKILAAQKVRILVLLPLPSTLVCWFLFEPHFGAKLIPWPILPSYSHLQSAAYNSGGKKLKWWSVMDSKRDGTSITPLRTSDRLRRRPKYFGRPYLYYKPMIRKRIKSKRRTAASQIVKKC